MDTDTLYLVDGSNFLFRAYHALPPMTTRAGTPTGAVFGFTNMLLRLLQEGHPRPSHLAVVFDAGGRQKRVAIYPAYKANRAETPEDLRPQFDLMRKVVRALGLPVLDARAVEADDVIATLARRAREAGLRVVIVSSDKDLMQLCREGQVTMLDTMKDGGKEYGPAQVREKFGVAPEQLGDVLALMGDGVDNVPGVPGVGEKTAAALIGQFGSLAALLERIDEIKVRGADKVKAALREHRDQVLLARQLVALDEEAEVALTLDELRRREWQQDELLGLFRELEFQRLLSRLGPQAATAAPPKEGAAAPQVAFTTLPPRIISTAADLAALAAELAGLPADRALGLFLPLAGHSDEGARATPICGLALTYAAAEKEPPAPAYLPLQHRYLGAPAQLAPADVIAALGPLLQDPGLPKHIFCAKDAFLALDALGVGLRGVVSDPALCSYLLDAGQDHDLTALGQRFLGAAIPARTDLCQSGKRAVPLESVEIAAAAGYAGAAAQATLVLGQLLRGKLSPEATALLDGMELPLSRVLATIERHGVLLDTAVLRQLSEEVAEKLRALESDIQKEAGYEVNIGSPKQLGELLFEKLQLPVVKKTKTGYSTDAEVLETLAADHPIARRIHEHRGLAKLKNTYIDQLPQLVDPRTGRLHTSYQQVVAATGRLSSTEPNLQNVPIRTELGRRIRRAFIAPPGHVLVAADYSQIELRVLAHLSQDPLLLLSFQTGEDVHERTAIEMFGPETGRKSEMRRAAKVINYGIVYGVTDYGLAVRLGIDRGVAKSYIKEYFARYAGVKRYMDGLVEEARRLGGARTLLGRFRPLPDIATRNYQARGAAERMAKNTPIQGTAADILKRAMIDVQRRLEGEAGLAGARMLLTVHDELVLEAPAALEVPVRQAVQEAMEGAYKLDVPLQVDVSSGPNWADCE